MDIAHVLKSGYLTKLDRVSQRSWKKRFFVLTDNQIGYYESGEDLSKPKGTMLLFNDCTVQKRPSGELLFTFVIITPYTELHVSAGSEEEADEWVTVLQTAFEKIPSLPRDMITKKGGFFDGTKARYIIMHSSALTYHEDSSKVRVVLGTMPLADCYMEFVENASISLTRGRDNWTLLFDGSEEESAMYKRWKAALQEQAKAVAIALNTGQSYQVAAPDIASTTSGGADHATADAANTTAVDMDLTVGATGMGSLSITDEAAEKTRAHANILVRSEELLLRPLTGGDKWDPHTVRLTNGHIEILKKDPNSGTFVGDHQLSQVSKYPISLSCAAFETNLGQFAFEVVTPMRILHLRAPDKPSLTEWVKCIREVIVSSRADPSDPLFYSAMLRIKSDVLYEVVFPEQKPLGVVLERAGEWGIVLKANAADTQISIGSVLTAVNDKSVVLNNYMETINLLKGWKPPLKLVFRKAPEKEGWLMKQSTGKSKKSAVVSKNWKKRYFVLSNGRLIYREGEAAGTSIKGDLPLMGSAVSLVSSTETKRLHCFRLVSGVTSLVMQASSAEEMMEWASTLHHASFIANGGNHIVGLQRARAAQEHRREQEAAEKAEAQAAYEASLADAEKAHQESIEAAAKEEEKEKERRAVMQQEEVARLEASDRMRALRVLQLNTNLKAATQALLEVNPFSLEVLQQAQVALQAAEGQPGCDEVSVKKAEFAVHEAVRSRSAEIEVLRLLQDALVSGSAAALTHALAEADFLGESGSSFEEEQVELLERVQAALGPAKARDDALVALQLAMDSGDMEAVSVCYVQAQRLRVHSAELSLVAAREALTAAGMSVPEQIVETEAAVQQAETTATESDAVEPQAVSVPVSCPGSPAATAVGSVVGSTPVMETAEGEFENQNDSEDEEEEEESEEGKDTSTTGSPTADADTGANSEHAPTAPSGNSFAARRATFTGASGAAISPTGGASSGLSFQEVIRRNKASNLSKRAGQLELQKARKIFDPSLPADQQDPSLASVADIKKLFQSYCKAVEGMNAERGEFLNPMQFSSILRLVTEEKSNLFKEMQLFKRFDVDNNASVNEQEFVQGWFDLSKSEGHGDYLYNIKKLVGEDNILL